MTKDQRIMFRLTTEEMKLLKIRCYQDNITMSDFFRQAILCYCNHQEGLHSDLSNND